MNCRTVQISLSAHLDGALSADDRIRLLAHLDGCGNCESRLQELTRVRAAIRRVPPKPVPVRLTTVLRVTASKERQRVLARRSGFGLSARFHLWVDNLMRPLALPFAGGLVSALLLFSMLVPTFVMRRGTGADIPVALFTEPSVKAQMPFPAPDNDIDVNVEVLVDDQGRMVDYTLPKGSNLEKNPELRRLIENKLLFTEFTPATMFGQPTYGKVNLSFQRHSIEIKS